MRLPLPAAPSDEGTQRADRLHWHAGDQVACRLEKTLIRSMRANQRATLARTAFAATDASGQGYIHLRRANTCDQTQNARTSLGGSGHMPICEDVVNLGLRITEAPVGPVFGFPEPSGSPDSISDLVLATAVPVPPIGPMGRGPIATNSTRAMLRTRFPIDALMAL